eukprot:CAMPEP_0179112294 /NCGR_PEP_ID=MMETSP0796-20121207/52485_1 /TAXON_ID=73915 /ORGANISM="Pyrodinium bahamense, Strain pbaha01" /LENGTH=278 /DNA_ID=CAMNT_0020810459 /DNA_START=66 /DNA_END=902 /DNA_ORIENTATION=-
MNLLEWVGGTNDSTEEIHTGDRDPRDPTSMHAPRTEVLHRSSQASSSSSRRNRVYRERVLVRVYDLGQTFVTRWHNKMTKSYGAFHTGVEVYGHEWSFGMTFDEWSTGVTSNAPKQNPDHNFRETLSMGYTTYSPKEVMQIIDDMKISWKGSSYNVLSRNCHNFSDEFCQRLGVTGLPAWVNDLAYTGAEAVEFLDSADSGYDGGAALLDFLSSMRSSVYNTFVAPERTESDPYQERRARDEEAQRHRRAVVHQRYALEEAHYSTADDVYQGERWHVQ